jgi:hypothetical protein
LILFALIPAKLELRSGKAGGADQKGEEENGQ